MLCLRPYHIDQIEGVGYNHDASEPGRNSFGLIAATMATLKTARCRHPKIHVRGAKFEGYQGTGFSRTPFLSCEHADVPS